MKDHNGEKEVIKNVENLWDNKKVIKISDEQFDYMEIKNRKILVKKDNDGLIWANFIVYKTVKDKNWNNHYYFYAHSWPTQYYIWKWFESNVGIWDIITIGNITTNKIIKYKVYNIKNIKENIKDKSNISFEHKNDSLFFTCDKGWNERKIFLLTQLK